MSTGIIEVVEVEKGIPLPAPRGGTSGGKGRDSVYPWRGMEVGDSFFTRNKHICNMVTTAGARYGAKYTSRKATKEFRGQEVDGWRVWRVE